MTKSKQRAQYVPVAEVIVCTPGHRLQCLEAHSATTNCKCVCGGQNHGKRPRNREGLMEYVKEGLMQHMPVTRTRKVRRHATRKA